MYGSDAYLAVTSTELGHALKPGGGRVTVVATKHRNSLPGFADDVCFAVQEHDPLTDQVVKASGFTSEEDCWRFVTGRGELGFDVPDSHGRSYKDVRVGLNVPDGLVKRYAADVATGTDGSYRGSIPQSASLGFTI